MKTRYGIIILALATLLYSCSQELDMIQNGKIRTLRTVEAEVSEVPETKAHLEDGSKIIWDLSDKIGVFSETGDAVPFAKTNEGNKFSSDTPVNGHEFYAFYPYTETVFNSENRKQLSFSIGNTTIASGPNPVLVVPMVARAEGTSFSFTQTCGILHFSITGTGSLHSLTLSGNKNEKIAGTFTVNLEETTPVLTGDGSEEFQVFAPDSPVALSSETAYDVYFILPPMTLEDGFSISINYGTGTIVKKTEKSVTFARSIIRNYDVVNLDQLIEEDTSWMENAVPPDNEIWYTSSSGRPVQPGNVNFGAALVSNTYENGKGVMRFSGAVTSIPRGAFMNFDTYGSMALSGIALPLSVTRIETGAFFNLENLRFIILQQTIERIEYQAFMHTGLEVLDLPDNVELGGNISVNNPNLRAIYSSYSSADNRCLIKDGVLLSFAPSGITDYIIPEGIEEVDTQCFLDCRELQRIVLPSSLKRIGMSAFENTGLIHMTVPEGVESIDKWAFRLNSHLESISFPSTLNIIGSNIIGGCDNLVQICGKYASSDSKCLIVDGELISFARKGVTSYTIPEEVSIIGEDVFWDDDLLTDVTISEGVKEIKRGAFYGCDNISSIYFPGSLEVLGSRILSSASLQNIRGPFASIDGRCFIFNSKLITVACSGLTSYVLPEGIKEIGAECFLCANQLTELIIPEGVTTIDENAIRICNSLKSITIPSSVTTIGKEDDSQDELFYACPALKRILCKATIPPQLSCRLIGESVIYVLNESLDSYLSSPNWVQYNLAGVDSFIAPSDYYSSSDYAQNGVVVCLQHATVGDGIDIVLVGDAFSDRLITDGTYDSVMQKAASFLFSEEPFSSFKDCFNVYYVYAVSENEVITAFSETAIGTYFGSGTFIGGDISTLWGSYVVRCPIRSSDNTLAIVILNTDRYAGTCHMSFDYNNRNYGCGQATAFVPLGSSDEVLRNVLLHEAGGHGFAKLDDEYGGKGQITETEIYMKYDSQFTGGWYRNTDLTDNPTRIKWAEFIADDRYKDEVGIYEGGGTFDFGTYRPTENSIMRDDTGEFNAPSRYAIWYRINKLAYGEDWNGTYEDFVTFDLAHRLATSSTKSVTRNFVEKQLPPLAPPVIVNKDWRELLSK
ncbi:MAG: leucine-rich repeat protein [Bacteroidales bacterium]|nr:leucine-rich repeat protein [Bacteroidales bacterium]